MELLCSLGSHGVRGVGEGEHSQGCLGREASLRRGGGESVAREGDSEPGRLGLLPCSSSDNYV